MFSERAANFNGFLAGNGNDNFGGVAASALRQAKLPAK
jgi:hypothetical protein